MIRHGLLLGALLLPVLCTAQTLPAPAPDAVPLEQLRIEARHTVLKLSAATLADELIRCVPSHPRSPWLQERGAALLHSGATTALGHVGSASVLILRGSSGVCLRRSSAGYPIFAVESFYATVNPQGVPQQIADEWYRRIAERIASHGTARVAYHGREGTIFLATYRVKAPRGHMLEYELQLFKADTPPPPADLSFRHATLHAVSLTKRGDRAQKPFPLDHRRPSRSDTI